MKHLLIILSILLLSSPLFGQSKPLGVVLPPTVMGNVSNSRKQILLNTLDEEVSKYFDVSPPTNVSSGDLPVVSDVFQLQIVEEDGDTQLTLRWMSGNERKVETILCGGCKTIELNGKLVGLVGKLVGGNRVVEKPVIVVKKSNIEILYEYSGRWYKSYKGWSNYSKYSGEVTNGLPNGQGSLNSYSGFDGTFDGNYEGEFKDGKRHGQGTETLQSGEKLVGEFKDGTIWNTTYYDENGNFFSTTVNGEHGDCCYERPPNQKHPIFYDGKWIQGTLTFRNGEKRVEVVVQKKEKGVLYFGKRNGKVEWYKSPDGVEGNGEYVGDVENGFPNGQGTNRFSDGTEMMGTWVNGEFRNGIQYDYRNNYIIYKIVNGEWIRQ